MTPMPENPSPLVAYRGEASPKGAVVYAESEGVTLCAAVARFPSRWNNLSEPQVRVSASSKEVGPELGRLTAEAILGCLARAERLARDPQVLAAARAVAEAEEAASAVLSAKVLAAAQDAVERRGSEVN